MYDPFNSEILGKTDPLNRSTGYLWENGMHKKIFWPDQVEDLRAGLEVDHQVRARNRRNEELVDHLVEGDFVVLEIEIREDLVLCDHVVGDHPLVEQVPLGKFPLLTVAGEEKKKLRLEGVFSPVIVKPVEKRVVGDLLLDEADAELLGQLVLGRYGMGEIPRLDAFYQVVLDLFVFRVSFFHLTVSLHKLSIALDPVETPP